MKSSVVLFMNELAYKIIREEEANPGLFSFLWQTCVQLDETNESIAGFPVRFVVNLMPFLGITPQNNYSSIYPVFNMREGIFQEGIPNHPDYLNEEASRTLSAALASRVTSHASRVDLLEILLHYYQLHIPGFTGLKSHHILHDVLA
jgi:DNA repair protein RecO (recombination protein O)